MRKSVQTGNFNEAIAIIYTHNCSLTTRKPAPGDPFACSACGLFVFPILIKNGLFRSVLESEDHTLFSISVPIADDHLIHRSHKHAFINSSQRLCGADSLEVGLHAPSAVDFLHDLILDFCCFSFLLPHIPFGRIPPDSAPPARVPSQCAQSLDTRYPALPVTVLPSVQVIPYR